LQKKIKCPVWMGIGLQDDVCPPSTSFVTYNYLQSEKKLYYLQKLTTLATEGTLPNGI
jgi:cephalosporin-C deacetylase-like acetyl esterase